MEKRKVDPQAVMLKSMRVDAAPTLRSRVAERLRRAVVEGVFRPGARLVERELCEMLGVSRGSVREALRELEHDGLITVVPNRGPTVSVLDYKTAKSIYEIRAVLEGWAAAQFARKANAEQMQAMRKAIDALNAAVAEKSMAAMQAAKQQFDEVLMEGADNPIAATMLNTIRLRIAQLRLMSLSQSDRPEEVKAEMLDLYEAIADRDEERARKASETHIKNAANTALKVL